MTPQKVTARYIRNLLCHGRNDVYEIIALIREIATADAVPIGIYYKIKLAQPGDDFRSQDGTGASPEQALARALEKFGVTFR